MPEQLHTYTMPDKLNVWAHPAVMYCTMGEVNSHTCCQAPIETSRRGAYRQKAIQLPLDSAADFYEAQCIYFRLKIFATHLFMLTELGSGHIGLSMVLLF